MNKIQEKLLKWSGLSYLVDAANWTQRWRRPWEPMTVNTIGKEVTISDWAIILSDSRKLYCNLGPVKGAIDDKATYSIGRAWNAKFLGKDKEWGKKAEDWVNNMWYPMADARGGMFDFKTDLFLSSVSIDRDGEIFVLLTESADGWPQIQLLPAHMVGYRNWAVEPEVVEDGPYKGMMYRQGVVFNEQGRAVAYNVESGTEYQEESTYYSARDLIQVFDPSWADQVRGFPAFMHAILDLKTLRTVQGYEEIAAMLMSSIGLIEKNEMGAPDPNDPSNFLQKQTNMFGPTLGLPIVTSETTTGVTTRFFRSGSGSGLEQLKSDRPGEAVSMFMDRLIRNACVGAGWPFELTWDSSKLGGANVRLLIARAMRTVEDRQDLLRPVARRCVGYAVAKAIKNGWLPPNDEWYSWGFTLPARITADYGRDAKADLNDYQAGIASLTDILAEEGKDIDQFLDTLAAERDKMKDRGLPIPNGVAPNAVASAVVSSDADEADEGDTQTDDSAESDEEVDQQTSAYENPNHDPSSGEFTSGSGGGALKSFIAGSKVVDESGAPKILFHGTQADFDNFDIKNFHSKKDVKGFYFTPSKGLASSFSAGSGKGKVLSVALNIKNPATMQHVGDLVRGGTKITNVHKELMKRGFDGIYDPKANVAVAFKPEQIKILKKEDA